MNPRVAVAVAASTLVGNVPGAETQTANFTLYGRLNLTAEVVSAQQSDGSKGNYYQVNSNSSRLGVRSTESPGGGLSAIFQIESGVAADTGGGLLASRDTYVGLKGDWGTFRIGYYLTPLDDFLNIFGNATTFTTSILNTASVWARGGLSKTGGGFDARLGNSLSYETPTLGGFKLITQVSQLDASADAGGTLRHCQNAAATACRCVEQHPLQ